MLPKGLLRLGILCQVILLIYGQDVYFGPSRHYACHCNGDCDVNTGACSGECQSGWMGASCQYVNLATGEGAYVSGRYESTHRSKVVDGHDYLCQYVGYGAGSSRWIRIVMRQTKWITGIQITVHKNNIDAIKQVAVSFSKPTTSVTYTSGPSQPTGLVYNIVCDEPVLASEVTISFQLKFSSGLKVCEARLSGGLNIAVKKPANQTNSYFASGFYYAADLAVDGITSRTFEDKSCAHTAGNKCDQSRELNWEVDLQGSYRIYMVRIYNRNGFEYRLGGFILKTKAPGDTAWRTVYRDDKSAPEGVITIVPNIVFEANIVRVTLPRCDVLCLCEVQVFTDIVCPDDKYGFDCSGTCNCKNKSEACDKVTGSCSSGCATGYTGHGCREECPAGTYGDGCQATCISCRDTSCSPINGRCRLGCGPGWRSDSSPLCDEACPDGTFGEDCNSTCRCRSNTEVCDKTSGSCTSGCAAGYEKPNCQQKCETGKYGLRCAFHCRSTCLNDVCDHVTGTCYTGCKAGYMGDLCSQRCGKDSYGINCSESCSENCRPRTYPAYRICKSTTGRCHSGCQPGWTTDTCETPCDQGWFGDRCSQPCNINCGGRDCHHVNGSCTSGCVEGKQGERCQQDCTHNTYGPDCRYKCSEGCKDQRCSAQTGVCLNGCRPGWLADNCSLECPRGFYGDKCHSACRDSCDGGVCDNVNGDCTLGCVAGYKGAQCNQECESGKYGPSCTQGCAEGCDGGICNRTDGACTCVGGWMGLMCNLECGSGFYGRGCLEVCSPNCEGSLCEGTQGMCLGCPTGWKGEQCQDRDGMSPGVMSGIVVACLLIIALGVVIAILIVRRNSPRKSGDKTIRYDNARIAGGDSKQAVTIDRIGTPAANSQASLLLSGSGNDENTEVYYNIATTSPSTTVVTVADLPQYVQKWRLNKQHLFEEFQKLPKDLVNDCDIAKAAHNLRKNRYKNICAYDHSRVVLQTDPTDPDAGDYINACYIDTPKKAKAFIASQGPNDVIIDDFIRMLWELNIKKVVMLTNLFEEGKQKCHQYWPNEGEKIFGNISVTVRKTTTHANYTVRKLSLAKDNDRPKQVIQFHFTAWPDKGVPRSAASLLDFRDKVMATGSSNQKPVVVHCSAGIGRTGTFIALQYLKEEAELSATQDIYTCVWSLRQQRVNMVQTKDQYVFLHEACLMSLITSSSTATVPQFRQQHEKKLGDISGLQREFQTIQDCPVKVDEDEFYVSIKLDKRNRYSAILAGHSNRPVLTPNPDYEEMSGTYINAVFIPSYDAPHKFIQTQSPLPNTVADLWRLVADYDVDMIFMLDNYTQSDGDVAVYWPSVRSPIQVGPFLVECLTSSQSDEVIVRNLNLKQGDSSKKLVHITAKFWTDDDVPSVSSLVQLVRMSQTKKDASPIVVHCRSGADRSGLFCTVAAIIDRINADGTVAVPVVVGNSKAIRRQNIPDVSQYKFCYEAAVEYLGSDPVYSKTEVGDEAEAEENFQEDVNVYSNIDEDEHIYSNQ